MKSSRMFVIVLLVLYGPRLWAELRAEFTSSDPERWVEVTVISRTAPDYPARRAQHVRQAECDGWSDFIYSDFADSYWISPTTPAGTIVFVWSQVDPLEILDFHVRVGSCVRGNLDFENRIVTATLRLFNDGALIDEQRVDTRNCILDPDGPFGCASGFAALPYIGTYPLDAKLPTISFAPDSTLDPAYRRIMNRTQTLGGYPSPYQQRLVGSPSVADVGGVIEIEIVVTGADGHPAANVNVYPRVIDPPDPAPYRSDRKKGDNRDTTPPSVSGAPGYEVQIQGTTGPVLRTDSAGKIYARLQGSTREAGDNYRLRVSLFRSIPDTEECSSNMMAAPCFESQVFTVWKRAAVENDRMIQGGTFIAQDYNGGTKVYVVVANTFKPAAGATLVFMHAGAGAVSASSELRSIVSYKNGVITLSQPLAGTYDNAPSQGAPHEADAVGIWGSGFFDVSVLPLTDALASAFVEVRELPQSMPYFPYVDKMSDTMMKDLAGRWREAQADAHLIGARYASYQTFGTQRFDYSYVWTQQCINYTSLSDQLRNEVAAHEVVHQWDVNITAGRASDHCDLNAYFNTASRCSMHTYIQQSSTQAGSPVMPEFRDGVVEFHYVLSGGTADSEYLGLRSKDGVQ